MFYLRNRHWLGVYILLICIQLLDLHLSPQIYQHKFIIDRTQTTANYYLIHHISFYQIQLVMQLLEPIQVELSEKFKLIKLLGKGSFGNVYECIDLKDSSIYAVKVISKINVRSSKIESLKEEAKLLKSLSHKNIVKIYEYGEFQSCIYIKMQIAQNGNLQTLIERKRRRSAVFSDDETANIMAQIFTGISYIHSLNIIHRDIKPQNILLTEEKGTEIIKIADFGLSTKLNFHYPKSAITKCGTLLFMAPEILCKYSYTKAIDVWSASIIMFILVNGSHPIWNDTMTTDQYSMIMSRTTALPPLKSANNLAVDFFSRISKIDPHERYSSQEGLKHPWITRQFQDEIPLAVHESYSSFATGNQMSKIMKLYLVVRNIVSQKKAQVPLDYRNKILSQKQRPASKDMLLTNSKLKKLKSLNFDVQFSSDKKLELLQDKCSVQRHKLRAISEADNQNPAINKLNQIFNTLFDKKITSKKTLAVKQKIGPSITESLINRQPATFEFKDLIERQIEKSVYQVLERGRYKDKRILSKPNNKGNQGSIELQNKTQSSLNKANLIRKGKIKKKNLNEPK